MGSNINDKSTQQNTLSSDILMKENMKVFSLPKKTIYYQFKKCFPVLGGPTFES